MACTTKLKVTLWNKESCQLTIGSKAPKGSRLVFRPAAALCRFTTTIHPHELYHSSNTTHATRTTCYLTLFVLFILVVLLVSPCISLYYVVSRYLIVSRCISLSLDPASHISCLCMMYLVISLYLPCARHLVVSRNPLHHTSPAFVSRYLLVSSLCKLSCCIS